MNDIKEVVYMDGLRVEVPKFRGGDLKHQHIADRLNRNSIDGIESFEGDKLLLTLVVAILFAVCVL